MFKIKISIDKSKTLLPYVGRKFIYMPEGDEYQIDSVDLKHSLVTVNSDYMDAPVSYELQTFLNAVEKDTYRWVEEKNTTN